MGWSIERPVPGAAFRSETIIALHESMSIPVAADSSWAMFGTAEWMLMLPSLTSRSRPAASLRLDTGDEAFAFSGGADGLQPGCFAIMANLDEAEIMQPAKDCIDDANLGLDDRLKLFH